MSQGESSVFLVDVFAENPFTGNPAFVCLLPCNLNLSEEQMKKISAEIGCTAAFLSRINQHDTFTSASKFKLRWFTSTTEIKLCGHATLGTGAVLANYYDNKSDGITFVTSGGELVVKKEGSKLALEVPIGISEPIGKDKYSKLISAFGDIPTIKEVEYCKSLNYMLIDLQQTWSRKEFESWGPDIPTIQAAGSDGQLKIVMITMKADHDSHYQDVDGNKYDYVCRVFGPWLGAPEDPVTGSGHAVLASYWSTKLGKTQLYARQCSPRGGNVNILVKGDKVELKGSVTKVLQGVMNL
ncbi:hypothetical protein LOTGIDRAFT_229292 [Lottia gigantea]|uniref:Phenazine biosynthesis-like domain-containing protein n=1 Tax=Lottia gigantea TaxID=225164 RepID=V3Z8C9_LOTGI|nr:hypothetical protein LOTGIDRAFT_229292 [Lottia gigantea]ESO87138.1 hypothetical protein LOTGIDRAFT_229292 [Lottia gigantea]